MLVGGGNALRADVDPKADVWAAGLIPGAFLSLNRRA